MDLQRRIALKRMNFWKHTTDLLNNLYKWSMRNWKIALDKGKKLL